jgi:hypothetical protein
MENKANIIVINTSTDPKCTISDPDTRYSANHSAKPSAAELERRNSRAKDSAKSLFALLNK